MAGSLSASHKRPDANGEVVVSGEDWNDVRGEDWLEMSDVFVVFCIVSLYTSIFRTDAKYSLRAGEDSISH